MDIRSELKSLLLLDKALQKRIQGQIPSSPTPEPQKTQPTNEKRTNHDIKIVPPAPTEEVVKPSNRNRPGGNCMIKVLILFIVLIAGIIIGPIVAGHQGYVLIQTNNYDIETSVTGLVICFIILQFIFCLLGWCYRRIRGTSSFTHNWQKAVNIIKRTVKHKKHY